MLRITRYTHNASSTTLKVEGRIIADWVMVLKQAIDAEFPSNSALELDFTGVTFVDEAGIRMLCDLPHHNVLITHCAGFIEALLIENQRQLKAQSSNIL